MVGSSKGRHGLDFQNISGGGIKESYADEIFLCCKSGRHQ